MYLGAKVVDHIPAQNEAGATFQNVVSAVAQARAAGGIDANFKAQAKQVVLDAMNKFETFARGLNNSRATAGANEIHSLGMQIAASIDAEPLSPAASAPAPVVSPLPVPIPDPVPAAPTGTAPPIVPPGGLIPGPTAIEPATPWTLPAVPTTATAGPGAPYVPGAPGYGGGGSTVTTTTTAEPLPEWLVPAAIGLGAFMLLSTLRRR